MSDSPLTDRAHSELLALQNLAVADIAFYKQQQWKLCNYGLVLCAAIVAVPKLVAPTRMSSLEFVILGILAVFVLVSGIVLVNDMGKSLAKSRDRLPALRKHFDRELSLRAYAADDDPQIALLGSKDKASLERFLNLVLVLGFALTIWLLFRFASV